MSADEEAVRTIKERQRAAWSTGDYPSTAKRFIWDVGDAVVDRAGVSGGERVLDVAAGSGNASIPAAAAGAEVIALDLTPELFEAGRANAAEAGVEIEWVEGDAESLPFDDGSFDAVISTFGVMFAPRQEVAAAELVRVTRPGGRVVVAAWTPEGFIGRFFKNVANFLPPPPGASAPPVAWGDEERVHALFDPLGVELELERRMVSSRDESPEAYVEFMENNFGPLIKAREALDGETWERFHQSYLDLVNDANAGEGGALALESEYLMTVARKPG